MDCIQLESLEKMKGKLLLELQLVSAMNNLEDGA